MSDTSQGEGWWVASDGRWYPPQDHPNDREGSPLQVPDPQSSTSGDSAEEPSTDRSAVALATARQCVNGHEMPESHVFCSVCGSERSEDLSDFSAPHSGSRKGLAYKIGEHMAVTIPPKTVRPDFSTPASNEGPDVFAHPILVIVAVVVVLLSLGFGFVAFSGSSSPSSSSSSGGVNTSSLSYKDGYACGQKIVDTVDGGSTCGKRFCLYP